ncbi:MAG: hypothetical protein ACMG50_04465 [Thermomonas sp.]
MNLSLITNARPFNEARQFDCELRFKVGRTHQIGSALKPRDGAPASDAATWHLALIR